MEHFVSKTETPENIKDLWRTPIEFFNKLDSEFKFDIDACASFENALCSNYLSEEFSALKNEWNHYGENTTVFINPPYSKTQEFLNRARDQALEHNITVVALVNANSDTKWFRECADSANEIRLITGRLAFVR